MSRIALGTVQFGLPYGIANQNGQVSQTIASTMLRLAAKKGIDLLDTAIAYGDSESCLGKVGTNGFRLVTKLPVAPDYCKDITRWINEQILASLDRLNVNSVYGLLLHQSEQLFRTDAKIFFQALQDLKKAGLVQKIGVSIYSPSELDALSPEFRFDLVQAPFNLIDHRLYTSGWLKRLKHEGSEIHTRSTFLQGLLLMSRTAIPSQFAPWVTIWDLWHKWLENHSVNAVQACLAYPLSFPEIDQVIVGADSVSQLEQIIAASLIAFPDNFPELASEDEHLINPSFWSQL